MTVSDPNLLQVGTIVGTHGLRGDLKVRPLSGASSALPDAKTVYLSLDDVAPQAHTVRSCSRHKGNLLLKLVDVIDLAQAQRLIGIDVFVSASALPPLGADEYYWFELQGAEVHDRTRGLLGRLEEIFTTPAHDIYVVRGHRGEVLIPVVAPLVSEVAPEQRRILVDLPLGLVPGDDDAF